MPFRKRFQSRQRMSPINSEKNVFDITSAIGTGTNLQTLAIAVDSADNTVNNQVTRRCKIFRIWVELWVYGTLASGVNNPFNWYIIKNPGNNLTPPGTTVYGTSNEKKFIFRSGKGLLGRLNDGSPPYLAFRGWIKIPKIYQRMGTDDVIQIALSAGAASGANFCLHTIYKWFS